MMERISSRLIRPVLGLTIWTILAFSVCVSGDFGTDHLIHLYELHVGSPENCLTSFEVTDDDLLLTYGDFILSGQECSEGIIQLRENGEAKPLSELLGGEEKEKYGMYLATKIEEKISCGGPFIDKGTPLLFFRPKEKVTITVKDFFGDEGASDLGVNFDPEVEITLEKENKYLVIGEKCLFKGVRTGVTACFPSDAKITTTSNNKEVRKQMNELQIGDDVQSDVDTFSNVFAWSHNDHYIMSYFIKVTTTFNHSLTLSKYHYVPIVQSNRRRLVLAKDIDENSPIQLLRHDGSLEHVAKVETVRRKGLFNPHTRDGSIVVNGFVVSTFTAFSKPSAAHAALSPIRAAFSLSQQSGSTWMKWVHRAMVDAVSWVCDQGRSVMSA